MGNNKTTKKKILLTGASRGIGRSICAELLNTGSYDIVAPSRQEMDLNDLSSIEVFLSDLDGIDIVINNAGINLLKDVDRIDNDSLKSMLAVNLEAPLKIISCVSPHMKSQKFGRIINISSIWGVRSKEKRTLYSMTKFGINGITKALAHELGVYNILINSVCPGYVNTDMTKENLKPDECRKIKDTIPLKRFAEPVEIARFIKFLISEENTYITGQVMVIDGGFLA